MTVYTQIFYINFLVHNYVGVAIFWKYKNSIIFFIYLRLSEVWNSNFLLLHNLWYFPTDNLPGAASYKQKIPSHYLQRIHNARSYKSIWLVCKYFTLLAHCKWTTPARHLMHMNALPPLWMLKVPHFYAHHEMDGLCLDFSHKTIQIMWINVHEALLLLGQVNTLSNKILSYNHEYMLLLQRGEVQKVHQQ